MCSITRRSVSHCTFSTSTSPGRFGRFCSVSRMGVGSRPGSGAGVHREDCSGTAVTSSPVSLSDADVAGVDASPDSAAPESPASAAEDVEAAVDPESPSAGDAEAGTPASVSASGIAVIAASTRDRPPRGECAVSRMMRATPSDKRSFVGYVGVVAASSPCPGGSPPPDASGLGAAAASFLILTRSGGRIRRDAPRTSGLSSTLGFGARKHHAPNPVQAKAGPGHAKTRPGMHEHAPACTGLPASRASPPISPIPAHRRPVPASTAPTPRDRDPDLQSRSRRR